LLSVNGRKKILDFIRDVQDLGVTLRGKGKGFGFVFNRVVLVDG